MKPFFLSVSLADSILTSIAAMVFLVSPRVPPGVGWFRLLQSAVCKHFHILQRWRLFLPGPSRLPRLVGNLVPFHFCAQPRALAYIPFPH